jgi:hypothetical protein
MHGHRALQRARSVDRSLQPPLCNAMFLFHSFGSLFYAYNLF